MKGITKKLLLALGLLLLLLLVPRIPAFGLPSSGFSGETPGRNPTTDASPRSPGATMSEAGKEQSPSSKRDKVSFLPFGGRIIFVRPCNTGVLITVGPPRGGEYMLMPFSRVYRHGVFTPPAWTLGLAGPVPVVCKVGKFPIGAGLPIIMVGTSGI